MFRRSLGIAPHDYVAACRRRTFLEQLRGGGLVTEAIYASGYSSPSGVYGVAGGEITPAVYRRGAEGVAIEWHTAASPLGRILVAATCKGVCFVAVGADDRELETAVRAEFPKATLTRSNSARLLSYARAATAVADGRALDVSLPADIAGTAFQWRVWRALTKIPRGQRLTYAGLAKFVRAPRAVRAVGTACGANPLALVIPCHRVVGADGALRGYRWGLAVKRALLDLEGRQES
jgi:AraC family transcriptional regulator, regulatory protein of adaptative response / methylated-DNA-[protein]-cysteine methyltransferase